MVTYPVNGCSYVPLKEQKRLHHKNRKSLKLNGQMDLFILEQTYYQTKQEV